ncbi:MAG: HlyD family efflux transporter periplasmic adaptor subunit [Burkholderiaceae bacterium]|nr:HlyD family efflux transporter periplasmic adaptor subunit [Burkholderiaceae bacterium]
MALPSLREELALHPGPTLVDGQPSWTLQDPVRNQFFRIDWQCFEILSRWHINDAHAVAQSVSTQTTLKPQADDVEGVARFLADNQLLRPEGASTAHHLAQLQAKRRGSWARRLLHNYLFLRVPLVRPDRWLGHCLPWVAPFYTVTFLRLTLLALLFGAVEVWRDWERYSTTLVDTFSWHGLIGYAAALAAVKVLHELGHACTAKRYGCRVPVMGIAFLVLWPVAYADTNEVWKLADRRKRLMVAAAGVATESIIAIWATFAWALLPEGGPKSIAFMLGTVTWLTTLAINASPFMRFDGYFVLSDWLDMPNLHSRAFALARWHLREKVFDLRVPPPEYFSHRKTLALILFAYATWVYRLVVFFGIAVLVYHFFIKAAGIALFLVEIGWFVLMPLWSELKVWRDLAPMLKQRSRARLSVACVSALALLMVVPWPTRPGASGVLKPRDSFVVYAPAGAQVAALPWSEGSAVPKGAPLLELASPELTLRWRRAQSRLKQLRWQAAAAGLNNAQTRNVQVLQQEQAAARAELDNVLAELSRYTPTAPFAGELHDIKPDLTPGVWVRSRDRLATLVRPGSWSVEAYLDEDAVRRIRAGDSAQFVADGLDGPTLQLSVVSVDRDATRVLPTAMLATHLGGSVQTREQNGQLIPERAIYKVVLAANSDLGGLREHTWRGRVVVRGRWEAPGARFVRSALALGRREAGF